MSRQSDRRHPGVLFCRMSRKPSSGAHQAIKATAGQYVLLQVFHILHVNAYDSPLKKRIRRFNGVAAHKLPNFLGWCRLIESLCRKYFFSMLLPKIRLGREQSQINTPLRLN